MPRSISGATLEKVFTNEDITFVRSDASPELAACLKALQPGNTLVLWKLDRPGRDLPHLVNTVEDLCAASG